MSAAPSPTPVPAAPPPGDAGGRGAEAGSSRFETAAAWHEALGCVPLERIRLTPAPGTATAEDALVASERKPLVELVHGTLVEKAMGFWESRIAAVLLRLLEDHARARDLGIVVGADATMRMPGGNVRIPDVSFIAAARVPTDAAPVPELCPDLAVEILSKGNTPKEMDQKRRELFAGGTRLMWVIDAATGAATVYADAGGAGEAVPAGGHLDGGAVLPGFRVALADLFEGTPRRA